MNKVLILTDGKAGHENQSKAFARALGFEFDLVEVHFKSPFAKILSYLFDNLGIHCSSLFKLPNPSIVQSPDRTIPQSNNPSIEQSNNRTIEQSNNPSIEQSNNPYAAVLGTGSGTFYAAKTLARKMGVKCGVVLYPRGYRISTFDCVLAPAFDRPASAVNVIEIPTNLVANDAAFYENGTKAFLERYTPSAKPAVAVIVGGPNKCSTMSADWMKEQLTKLFAEFGHSISQSSNSPIEQSPNRTIEQSNNRTIEQSNKVEFWVTTSRRTPPEVEAVVDSFPFDYKLLYSKDHFNPIPAFVKLAKTLCVTAESTGMLSESCTFGAAEVRALDNLNPGPHKFRRFVEDLIAGGYVNGARKVDLSEQFVRARALLSL